MGEQHLPYRQPFSTKNIMKQKLFQGGDCTIRRFGNYVNTVANTEFDIRTFITKNVPPMWDFLDDEEYHPAKLPDTLLTGELMKIAEEQGYTFEVA